MKLPDSLNLYVEGFLSEEDAQRQTRSAQIILDRFDDQPGVILGDEVGMGKTFVALAVASAKIMADDSRPIVVMVPKGVVGKWERDATTFRTACLRSDSDRSRFRVAKAESGVDFLKLLDDEKTKRATLIIMSHGAMHRKLADKWVKLAVLQASIKGRHGVDGLRHRLARFAPMVLRHARNVDEHYDLYLKLLETHVSAWKSVLVEAERLTPEEDDPVPVVIAETLGKVDLTSVFLQVVEVIPERGSSSLNDRIKQARNALDGRDGGAVHDIWRACLKSMHLTFPMLILDEAHRTRNAGTQLSTLLSASREDLDTVGGQLNERFERMLFLTATPFQLGHSELRTVLLRFDSINWRSKRAPQMGREAFGQAIEVLHQRLDSMQLASERLEKAWKKLLPQDVEEAEKSYGTQWWLRSSDSEDPECRFVVNERIRSVMLAFYLSQAEIRVAEQCLKPWVLRHSRTHHLPQPHDSKLRRVRVEGADVEHEANGKVGEGNGGGLRVGADNCLPFLLGAKVATLKDCSKVFGDGLASSYEAMLDTRRDDNEEKSSDGVNIVHGSGAWYVDQLQKAAKTVGANGYKQHPKMKATIDLAMSLWRQGEKVLIFCYYRETGAALHRHLSQVMIDEIESRACKAIGCKPDELPGKLRRITDAFDRDRTVARDVMTILNSMIDQHASLQSTEIRDSIHEIVLRFLRTPTFLVRFADLSVAEFSTGWVENMFDSADSSGMSLRQLVKQFLEFLSKRPNPFDCEAYLVALKKLQTGSHAGPEVEQTMGVDEVQGRHVRLVANVRRVYGETRDETRERIMLTFNTPFYPEILIASSVMSEGVDLHLNCRHVIHHDLDWNPSSLEQRTGRIDRLGSKAERSGNSIRVYLPYVEGCQDEKLYRVVMDRERWFGVVMGAEKSMARVLKASAWEIERMADQPTIPLDMVDSLRMNLGSV